MARVQCRRSDRLDAAFPALWGAEIEVRTRGGETLSLATADAPGSPTRPLGREGLRHKADSLIGSEAAERLVAATMRATGETTVAELLAAASENQSDIRSER
jgi:2-methylcitrate dehydratase PrpD